MATNILEAHDLVKKYGSLVAVDGISFSVHEDEVFGLLGPNGAGKSTAISMLTCLFPPTSGTATVADHDVVQEAGKVKQLIGVVPQDLALYPTLSARQNLSFFGEMFGLGGRTLRQRVDEVLDYVAMADRADDPVNTYSGGMKRRINLAVGLINHPRVLFLDEPTVGVDPQSRNHIFESVERLTQEAGMSILYTTHYMEEAERLCQRVGIIDKGKIIALDTPKNLVEMLGGGIIHIGVPAEDEELRVAVAEQPAVNAASFITPTTDQQDGDEGTEPETAPSRPILKVEAQRGSTALLQTIQVLNQKDVEILSVETLEPNLETVFLHLTGKSLRN
jgi:ABC-2 type transport system ATP-binding protein